MRVRLWVMAAGLCASCGNQEGGNGNAADETVLIDQDGDGVGEDEDCDDNDADVFPGNDDMVGDAFDSNCDDHDGVDADGDGFASGGSGGTDCDDEDALLTPEDGDGDGTSSCDGDCDDADIEVAPGRGEICDGIDTDCDGALDDDADGLDLCAASETFAVGGQLDVLFVIDNSCSMWEEQTALAGAGAAFLPALLDYDVHIGVVSTDMIDASQSGKLRDISGFRWIDSTFTQADATSFFDQAVLMGTSGDWNEMGIEAAWAALDALSGGYNAGFVRDDAVQHVVVLSDEDDHSANVTAGAFITWFTSWKATPDMAVWHAIVSPSPVCPDASEVGQAYLDVSAATAGTTSSICSNFSPYLSQLAIDIAPQGDDAIFVLTGVPDPATIAVTVTEPGGSPVLLDAADWVYDAVENTIEILISLSTGTGVQIDYRIAV